MAVYGEKRPVYTTLTDRDADPKLKSRLRIIGDVKPKKGKHRAAEEKEDGR